MRRIINSTYITLDGAIQDPQDWPSTGDDGGKAGEIQAELLFASDALVMGRHTYDGFAPVWQSRSGDPYSDRINTMPKYVVSSTLKDPEWAGTTVIGDDPVAAITDLKEQPGGDILQYGFGRLSYTMLEHGLLDEVRLWVHPFFIGRSAADLMFRECVTTRFSLVDTRTLESSIVILSYRVDS